MQKIKNNYLEKLYAGFLGKAIGVRLGAPVEPAIWDHDKIFQYYGELNGYVKDYTNFAADDDTNGPIFFIRALHDYWDGKNEITPEDIGNTWLNYAAEGHGMYWWGGYGISSEHTAYLNLKSGIKAPQSGSIKQNGVTLAEQIGGQIFIDSWGLVWPGNIKKAADYAEMAASVSHDGNGLFGARFVAACIAKAFDTSDYMEIVEAGLSVIPKESEFLRVNRAVLEYFKNDSENFRGCFKMLESQFGYDKYKGICHIIPNAGVVTLSLLYGKGNFSKSIEIATMCGWDTDCNAGNVGTIMGVATGIEGLTEKYKKPINDMIVASSIIGSLNIVDIPTFTKDLAIMGYRLAGEEIPVYLQKNTKYRELFYDFEIPGSTHGFRLEGKRGSNKIDNTDSVSFTGQRSLEVSLSDHRRYDKVKLFNKPFYRRIDFDDNRYRPQFSPLVYPGQNIELTARNESFSGEIFITFFIRLSHSKKYMESKNYKLKKEEWETFCWETPKGLNEPIDEIGIIFENLEPETYIGKIYIDNILISGRADYKLDFSKEKEEWDCVSQLTHNRGMWTLEEGKLHMICTENAEAYTGNYYMKNLNIKAKIEPKNGISHNLAFRVKGTTMGYHVGFNGLNKIQFIKNNHGQTILAEKNYFWKFDKEYEFEVETIEDKHIFKINGETQFEIYDDQFDYGSYGFTSFSAGRTLYRSLDVIEK